MDGYPPASPGSPPTSQTTRRCPMADDLRGEAAAKAAGCEWTCETCAEANYIDCAVHYRSPTPSGCWREPASHRAESGCWREPASHRADRLAAALAKAEQERAG